ncbi:hypothetical protein PV327_001900 [Microctonus hyperodae]|uniref:Nudix hydrolase domain-containing protein n=1 Tax=Microctonus hyperodae TaxID=165561 RepID=A0AA39FES1_MICHY|nr:hypothetical protein PV327_001900 [Microctonus hyperodae]
MATTVSFQSIRFILNWTTESSKISVTNLLKNYIRNCSTLNTIKMDSLEDCFIGKEDNHNGIIVDSIREPCSADIISKRLQVSLERWTKNAKKTIWFRVNRTEADWIPHLVKEGFYFHHTKEQIVILYRCLSSEHNIPPYAHTNLGVGSFVINDETNEILVIKEKYSNPTANALSMWKLPGGYVEPGECIPDAAEREVFEETGIRAKFKSLIGFRHAHNYNFGCSDIYMVARLTPETFDIRKCNTEILECTWMQLEEYANSPNVYELNRTIAKKMIEYLKNNIEIELIHGQRPNSTEPSWIYLVTTDNKPKNPQ